MYNTDIQSHLASLGDPLGSKKVWKNLRYKADKSFDEYGRVSRVLNHSYWMSSYKIPSDNLDTISNR